MNFRRGFHRLFIVATISWHVLCGGIMFLSWSSHFERVGEQKKDLAQCRTAATSAQPGPTLIDLDGNEVKLDSNGNPIANKRASKTVDEMWEKYRVKTDAGGNPIRPPAGYVLEKLDCDKSWPPVDASREWVMSLGAAVVPFLVYGALKVLAWIVRGFRI